MDRFEVYIKFRNSLKKTKNLYLKNRLEIFISPLYLYAIQCLENSTEKRFIELDFIEKIKILPKKIISKLKSSKETALKINATTNTRHLLKPVDIIFYPVEPTHLRQMIPVSSFLPPGTYLFVTDRILFFKKLKALGIKCVFLDQSKYKNSTKSEVNKNYKEELCQIANNFICQSNIEAWVEFSNSLHTQTYDILEAMIRDLLFQTKPTKFVVGSDITPEGRLSVQICKKQGISSVCIQHGSIAGEPLDGEHIVNHYLLYGQKAKDYLTSIGNDPNSLHVFGAPYLDDQYNNIPFLKHELFRKLKLNIANPTVLVALSGPGHCTTYQHFNLIVRSIVKFRKKHPEYNFLFKLHRKDRKENYAVLLKENDLYIPVIEAKNNNYSNNIFSWLSVVDVLITGSSTVALEAMLMKKPVITIDYLNEYKNVDFIDTNCTFHVNEESKLEAMLSKVLEGTDPNLFSFIEKNAQEYIRQYFYSEKSSTTERIARWLLKI